MTLAPTNVVSLDNVDLYSGSIITFDSGCYNLRMRSDHPPSVFRSTPTLCGGVALTGLTVAEYFRDVEENQRCIVVQRLQYLPIHTSWLRIICSDRPFRLVFHQPSDTNLLYYPLIWVTCKNVLSPPKRARLPLCSQYMCQLMI
jgi:hypothetical protein